MTPYPTARLTARTKRLIRLREEASKLSCRLLKAINRRYAAGRPIPPELTRRRERVCTKHNLLCGEIARLNPLCYGEGAINGLMQDTCDAQVDARRTKNKALLEFANAIADQLLGIKPTYPMEERRREYRAYLRKASP